MKKALLLFILGQNTIALFSQEIVNLVLVGKKGITEDIKEATTFIAIKKYPDGFQRLDYILQGPLQKVRTYSDSNLTILNGWYYEYAPDGSITLSGTYYNNQKAKDWYHYNDTGKVVLEEKYEMGTLIKTIDPDTIKKKEEMPEGLQKVEREATFKKGDKDWIKYLTKNLNADAGIKSVKGGTVRVGFTVNKMGKCVDVHLRKSVEFVLDHEAIRVIENSPLWEPALQNDRVVNAYRIQPLTFIKQ